MAKIWKVPFSSVTDEPLTYASATWEEVAANPGVHMAEHRWNAPGDPLIYKANYIFHAQLTVVSYARGRSSAIFWLKDLGTGKRYSIFMSDFVALIKTCRIDGGLIMKLDGAPTQWTFSKKGSNYGLQLVD